MTRSAAKGLDPANTLVTKVMDTRPQFGSAAKMKVRRFAVMIMDRTGDFAILTVVSDGNKILGPCFPHRARA